MKDQHINETRSQVDNLSKRKEFVEYNSADCPMAQTRSNLVILFIVADLHLNYCEA